MVPYQLLLQRLPLPEMTLTSDHRPQALCQGAILPFHASYWRTISLSIFPGEEYTFMVINKSFSHVQLWDPMGCSTPGFPVLHHLLELAQTHVHWVSQWRHPTISSSVTPFSSCLQSFPASGSFHLTISKPGPAPELPRLTLLPAFLVVFSRRGVTTTHQCFLPALGCSSSLYPFNVFSEGIWYLLSIPYVILY